jgi:hypothetical protein
LGIAVRLREGEIGAPAQEHQAAQLEKHQNVFHAARFMSRMDRANAARH